MYQIKLIDWQDQTEIYESKFKPQSAGNTGEHYKITCTDGLEVLFHPSSVKRTEIKEIT